jgi:hypothetical protein
MVGVRLAPDAACVLTGSTVELPLRVFGLPRRVIILLSAHGLTRPISMSQCVATKNPTNVSRVLEFSKQDIIKNGNPF